MRILVQRVFEAWVRVEGVEISRIKEGILVLVGLTHSDNKDVLDHMVSKTLNMRLWEKEGKSWAGSVLDIGGDIMVVSQFTLYGIMKGNKPDFHASMEAEKAREMFQYFVHQLKTKYPGGRIQTGKFQALMEVGSVINGPVTIEYQKMAEEKKPKVKKEKVEETQKKVVVENVEKEIKQIDLNEKNVDQAEKDENVQQK